MTSDESETDQFPFDPGEQREAVGDADPAAATALGLKNLKRVAALLIPATQRATESYDDLSEAYTRVVTQWRLELGHVTNVIGGLDSRELYAAQNGPRFVPVSKARQAGALQFLLDNAFTTPTFLIQPDLLRRIEPSGSVARVRTAQNSLMNSLLQASRLGRMVEQASADKTAYAPIDMLTDLRVGIWRELATPAVPIDVYRRNVQRVYLDTIDNRLNGAVPVNDELRALLKGELRVVDQQVARALPGVTDVVTRRHLQDVRESIARTLDPRAMRTQVAVPARAGGAATVTATRAERPTGLTIDGRYDYDHDPFLMPSADCWPDLTIR